jgi:protein gp37
MADASKISWTDHTFNPWMGCQRVSQGCVHCYAETLITQRQGKDLWGSKDKRARTSDALWKRPFKWNRESKADVDGGGRVHRVFCASLADVFEDAPVPNACRPDVFDVIRRTPWLDYQLLTKRPENIAAMLPDDWGRGWPNVWLGTSIEDRRVVDRAVVLGEVPAFRRFISYEPAIGPIMCECHSVAFEPDSSIPEVTYSWLDDYTGPDLTWYNGDGDLAFDWLIAGGESGSERREMELGWADDVRHQCEKEGVAFFFKQISAFRPGQGEDALGEVHHNFPASWDRSGLDAHPVYADNDGLLATPVKPNQGGSQ